MVPRLPGKAAELDCGNQAAAQTLATIMPQNRNGEGAATVDVAGICSFRVGGGPCLPPGLRGGADSLIWEWSSDAPGPSFPWLGCYPFEPAVSAETTISCSSWLPSIAKTWFFNHFPSNELYFFCPISTCLNEHTYTYIFTQMWPFGWIDS